MDTRKQGRSKEAKERKQAERLLSRDEMFFWEHAGYSYQPETETEAQGRIRCARELAAAEANAKRIDGWGFEWHDDWRVGDHVNEFSSESYLNNPRTCECCLLRDGDGDVIASVGCVDDATDEYRRVIEAELAVEALAEYYKDAETLDAH